MFLNPSSLVLLSIVPLVFTHSTRVGMNIQPSLPPQVAEDSPESPDLGHWETAVSMKSCMRWQALEPDVVTFNTLLSASGRWQGILGSLYLAMPDVCHLMPI